MTKIIYKNDNGDDIEYTKVYERLRKMKKDHEDYRVISKIIFSGKNFCVVSVDILNENNICIATGHAMELITEEGINATSALEIAETSALGRALNCLGYFGYDMEKRTVTLQNGNYESEYEPVITRLKDMLSSDAEYHVVTEDITKYNDNMYDLQEFDVIFSALIYKNGILYAKAHSKKHIYEKNDYEKTETCAIGRALGLAGFGSGEIATAEEIIVSQEMQKRISKKTKVPSSKKNQKEKIELTKEKVEEIKKRLVEEKGMPEDLALIISQNIMFDDDLIPLNTLQELSQVIITYKDVDSQIFTFLREFGYKIHSGKIIFKEKKNG